MGKRELLLIAGFVIAGVIVYQATAPAAAPGDRSFSIGQLIEHVRRGVRGNRASAEVTTRSTHPVDADVTELRLAMRAGEITVAGEDRADIEAELRVRSNGFDEAEARRLAAETVLVVDQAGRRLELSVKYPEAGLQRARISLKVPARLKLRLEGTGGELAIAKVAAVELGNARGGIQMRDVPGAVSGNHRNGELTVTHAGSVRLTTVGADVRLEDIRADASLNMRGGELRAAGLGGPVDLDTNGTDLHLEKLDRTTGFLRINAASGSVTVQGLRTDGRIDARGAAVDVAIDRAAPLAIYSEGGDPITVTPPSGGYHLDAVATDGSITLPAGTLEVAATGSGQRVSGPVHGGGPTLILRSARGNIVVQSR